MSDFDMRDGDTDKWKGPYGALTPQERLNNHYAEQNDPSSVKDHDLGAMDTVEQREKIMSEMRQNNGNASDSSGYAQCGSTALLAGAVYGGGEGGISSMIDAAEAYEKLKKAQDVDARKKAGLPPLPEEHVDMAALQQKIKDGKQLTAAESQAQGDSQMDALKAKLAKGEHMSSDDMQMMQNNMYRVLNGAKDDGTGAGAGIRPEDMAEFLKTSPALAKMYKDNDLHLENIATAGQAQSNHFVLGIGHDWQHKGLRNEIYDPQARVVKEKDDHGKASPVKNSDSSVRLDSQLVTNWDDLRDYQNLTRSEIDANGWHAPGETKAPRPKPRRPGSNPYGF